MVAGGDAGGARGGPVQPVQCRAAEPGGRAPRGGGPQAARDCRIAALPQRGQPGAAGQVAALQCS